MSDHTSHAPVSAAAVVRVRIRRRVSVSICPRSGSGSAGSPSSARARSRRWRNASFRRLTSTRRDTMPYATTTAVASHTVSRDLATSSPAAYM